MDDFESLGFTEPASWKSPASGIVEFSEVAYRLAYRDVEAAIGTGVAETALDHYARVGRAERRLETAHYIRILAGNCDERPAHAQLSFNVEALLVSESGVVFVVGWSDDRSNPLLSLSAIQNQEGWNSRSIARCRRPDAEGVLSAPVGHLYGFWMIEQSHLLADQSGAGPMMLRARFADGSFTQIEMAPRLVTDTQLRETALGHFTSLEYLGNRDIEAFRQLDGGAGSTIMALNRRITSAIGDAAYVARFGPPRERFAASFIVCLLGKSEYFFLQNALFATGRGARDIEFIYVSNSPELAETLHKEAQIAERIYGLSVTLVTLPDNAGFSAANNVATQAARSDRLVFINPDVFPRDDAWAVQHAAILETQPLNATTLFGAPLFYDDGSLMHGGMYFEIDRGLSVGTNKIESQSMIRVEHYGKGAPSWSTTYTATRPVPAVTGAFISVDRNWFERLDGFAEDYVFGHYEDADFCLRSLQEGVPAWLQDVRFWHLEGKGSVRRPVHEGGSLVNRWYFTRRWGGLIEKSLSGRRPSHPALRPVPVEPVSEPVVASDPKPRGGSSFKDLTARLTKRSQRGAP